MLLIGNQVTLSLIYYNTIVNYNNIVEKYKLL